MSETPRNTHIFLTSPAAALVSVTSVVSSRELSPWNTPCRRRGEREHERTAIPLPPWSAARETESKRAENNENVIIFSGTRLVVFHTRSHLDPTIEHPLETGRRRHTISC